MTYEIGYVLEISPDLASSTCHILEETEFTKSGSQISGNLYSEIDLSTLSTNYGIDAKISQSALDYVTLYDPQINPHERVWCSYNERTFTIISQDVDPKLQYWTYANGDYSYTVPEWSIAEDCFDVTFFYSVYKVTLNGVEQTEHPFSIATYSNVITGTWPTNEIIGNTYLLEIKGELPNQ